MQNVSLIFFQLFQVFQLLSSFIRLKYFLVEDCQVIRIFQIILILTIRCTYFIYSIFYWSLKMIIKMIRNDFGISDHHSIFTQIVMVIIFPSVTQSFIYFCPSLLRFFSFCWKQFLCQLFLLLFFITFELFPRRFEHFYQIIHIFFMLDIFCFFSFRCFRLLLFIHDLLFFFPSLFVNLFAGTSLLIMCSNLL